MHLDVDIRRLALLVIMGVLGLAAVAGVGAQGGEDGQISLGAEDGQTNPFAQVEEAPHDAELDVTFPLPAGTEDVRYDPQSFHEDPPTFGGDRGTKLHAPYGTPVFAMAPGLISSANADRGRVSIRADQEGRYSYDNLADLAPGIVSGEVVRRGQLVGWVGCSGSADCDDPHTLVTIKGAASSPYVGGYFNAYHSLAAAESRRDHPEVGEEAARGPAGPATRAAGRTRTATAVSLSRWAFDSAETVVIASRTDFPDALAAGALAGALDAPLLLAGGDDLGRINSLEISRLGAREAWVIGGAATLTDAVTDQIVSETSIPAEGIRRVAGGDRYETAALIAQEVIDRTDPDSAVVVSGRDYVDALSGSALGAATGMPVLLTRGDDLPDATAEVLASRDWDGPIYLAGGTAAIGAAVESAVGDATWGEVERLAGDDRWETSTAIADTRTAISGEEQTQVLVATGRDWPDALAAGPAIAARDAAFVIVDPRDLAHSAPSGRWLSQRAATLVESRVAGGEGAVSDQVTAQLSEVLASDAATAPTGVEARDETPDDGDRPIDRLAGPDRASTSTALARWAFDAADAVVVASRTDFPDALAAGALAGALDAPLLLADDDGLGAANLHAIARLGAREAWIVGGTAAVSEAVEAQLTGEAGLREARVRRIAGGDRYETAARIAQEVIDRTDPESAVVVSGRDYVDALSASALGAATGMPVLLTRGGGLPDATAEVLASRDWDGPIYVAGGVATIDGEVERTVAEAARSRVARLAGADRYATSVAIAETRTRLTGHDETELVVATGRNWPDALAAGPAVARRGAAFVIADPTDLATSSATASWLADRADRFEDGWVVGGPGAISDAVVAETTDALR